MGKVIATLLMMGLSMPVFANRYYDEGYPDLSTGFGGNSPPFWNVMIGLIIWAILGWMVTKISMSFGFSLEISVWIGIFISPWIIAIFYWN